MIRAFLRRIATLIRYGMSAGISFLVDYGLFALLLWAGASIMVSTYAARACSCIVNFLLNRSGVFRSSGDPVKQFAAYIALVIAASTVSGLAVTFLAARSPLSPVLLKLFVEIVLFFINYFVQRQFIFPDSRGAGDLPQDAGADAPPENKSTKKP